MIQSADKLIIVPSIAAKHDARGTAMLSKRFQVGVEAIERHFGGMDYQRKLIPFLQNDADRSAVVDASYCVADFAREHAFNTTIRQRVEHTQACLAQ